MHWEELLNSAAEGEACLLQFADEFGIGVDGQSFCSPRLNAHQHKRNKGTTVFLVLIDSMGQ
jgi:hypothetical protein